VSRPIVRERWLEFTEEFEGAVPCLYQDVRGLVTIAYGNLVDSPGAVASLEFIDNSGRRVRGDEIISAWQAVKGDPQCATRGWRYAAALPRNQIHLTRDAMTLLALAKFDANEEVLAKRCVHWASMPACAQMALHSLAWACGAGFHFPRLMRALDVHDYSSASVEIHMNERTLDAAGAPIRNSGLVPRNVANKILMRNAAYVEAYELDASTIDWTRVLGITDVATVPDRQNADHPPGGRHACGVLGAWERGLRLLDYGRDIRVPDLVIFFDVEHLDHRV
jgi:GH24 family phage-related lysozyme (muramidase)